MTELPPFIFSIHFEGAPVTCRAKIEQVREYLADVFEDDADRYQVWAVDTEGEASSDRTRTFSEEWGEACEFGSGDDPDEFLKPMPGFVLAHARDHLIGIYRQAEHQRDHEAFERSKVRSL